MQRQLLQDHLDLRALREEQALPAGGEARRVEGEGGWRMVARFAIASVSCWKGLRRCHRHRLPVADEDTDAAGRGQKLGLADSADVSLPDVDRGQGAADDKAVVGGGTDHDRLNPGLAVN